ncbi:hypothetical protein DL93DRAFT_2231374 [Clavulina sp. PMI_390]|nr:hypothetical protein DL93DRAFT_2231374 [Clavulina sp. PMI_390]
MIQSNLAIIEGYCAEVEFILQKVSQIQKRLLYQRAACISASTPIAALPVELLREVFQLATVTNRRTIADTSAVCRSWSSIVSEQRELWTSITLRAGDPCDSVVAHRVHSDSLPLNLEVNALRFSWPSRLKRAFPDMEQRLESMEWTSSASIQEFLYPEKNALFSALHTIKLSPPSGCDMCGALKETGSHGTFLSAASFPSLRRLEVEFVPDLEIPQAVTRTLEHLRLNQAALNSFTCRELLRNAPLLRTLEIRDPVDAWTFTNSGDFPEELTFAPSLESLIYHSAPVGLVDYISRTCVCPALRSLKLSLSTPGTTSPLLAGFIDHLGTFLDRSPQIYRLIVTESTAEEISLITVCLRSHGYDLRRFIFSGFQPIRDGNASLLPQLVETMQMRREIGAPELELETSAELIPILRETFPDATVVSSTREDCILEPLFVLDFSTW